jgi:hypothetical protein
MGDEAPLLCYSFDILKTSLSWSADSKNHNTSEREKNKLICRGYLLYWVPLLTQVIQDLNGSGSTITVTVSPYHDWAPRA